MRKHTSADQRREFYAAHQRGETYQQIADRYSVSKGCVRYWCRRQRDGGSNESVYHKKAPGILNGFDDLGGFYILSLKLAHPRWGPTRIRNRLKKEPKLQGKKLPSPATIGRYLHQWPRFRRQPKKVEDKRPDPPKEVHQQWQLDFKINIALHDGTAVDLHTVRDPVGEACIGAVVHITEQVNTQTRHVTLEDVRSTLRRCFEAWNTLPEQIQTDGEPTLVTSSKDGFPSTFTLWLVGLGIQHLVIRSGKPTDNAEVERCHRTINDYAIVGNEKYPVAELQSILDEAVLELAFDLPSRAEMCAGRTPIEAHPELLASQRPFRPEHELALFDLKRIDAFLSTFSWTRKVGKTGQICIGGSYNRYSVGRAYACQEVVIRFDPADRYLVFYLPDSEQHNHQTQGLQEIRRHPIRGIETEDLTGLAAWPKGLIPQQLALPLCFVEG